MIFIDEFEENIHRNELNCCCYLQYENVNTIFARNQRSMITENVLKLHPEYLKVDSLMTYQPEKAE